MNEEIYFPSEWVEGDGTLQSYVPFKEATWDSSAEEKLCHVTYDHEGHLVCAEHSVSQLEQDCAHCQHRRRSLVNSAKKMASNYDDPESVTTIVYRPLQAPKRIPKDVYGWAIQVGHEGVRLSIKDQYGQLARWRINLRDH